MSLLHETAPDDRQLERYLLGLLPDEQAERLDQASIEDDGVGIERASACDGLGMRSMRHRARLIGATLTVEPGDGVGTVVSCTVERSPGPGPSPEPEAAATEEGSNAAA